MATLLMFLGLIVACWAEIVDHGVFGELFHVEEQDMRELLKSRLNETSLKQKEAAFKAKAETAVRNPQPVQKVRETVEERRFTYDPSQIIEDPILDHQGRVLARAGDKINPLDHIQLHKGLLFIFGENIDHLKWALTHKDQFHIVLVNGSPTDLMKQTDLRLYFDQGGHICKRYGIQQIPARIEQNGKVLQISEFKIRSQG